MAFNLFEAPDYYGGLLGEEATQKLQNKALGTGVMNAVLGYLAQPKNQGYGSALPYLGRALAGGYQAGQETIKSGLTNYETQQKIAEMKRKQDQQKRLQDMLGGITDPNERLLAELAPEQYVTGKVRSAESPFAKIDRKDYTSDSFKKYLQSKDLGDLEPIVKEANQPSAVQEYNFARTEGYKGSFEDWKKLQKPEGVNVTYGAPMSGVIDGKNVFFQPSKTGGAPTIIPGITPPESPGSKPTEFQAKAGLYFNSMETASKTLNDLESKDFKFMPTLAEAAIDEGSQKGQIALSAVRGRTRKSYVQAQKQWIDSINRVRSGANLPEMEYNRAVATFFPQLNEPADIVEQKRLARQQEEQSMKTAAGNALPQNKPTGKQVKRTGLEKGTNRKVIEYTDGSLEYGN